MRGLNVLGEALRVYYFTADHGQLTRLLKEGKCW